MSFLLGNWKIIAVAALTAFVLAYTYRIGGNGPRAELAAYKTQIAAAAKAQEAHVAQVETTQKEVVRYVTKTTHDAINASDAYYRGLLVKSDPGSVSSLATDPSGIVSPAASVAPDSARCDPADGAADAIVILEWQRFYQGLLDAQK